MFYTHAELDRADHLRGDKKRVAALRNQPTTRLMPVWRGSVLVTRPPTGISGDAEPARIASMPSRTLTTDEIFLGMINGVAWFAWSVSALGEDARQAFASTAHDIDGVAVDAEFADLRVVGPQLNASEGALLAYARALVWWQDHARFCSQCGEALASSYAGHVRCCENDHVHFPRTDPAVIMLVTRQPTDGGPERVLLGRNAAWPQGTYSTLAGFVEPGESLEQAVSREVLEEANILTDNVRYITSQPWPFPRSIMLGFEARAISTDIRCEPKELEDARWFTREDLHSFGDWGDASDGFKLPRPDSIARFLINRWIQNQS